MAKQIFITLVLLFFFLAPNQYLFSQEYSKVDSLKRELKAQANDSVKIRILNQLAWNIKNSNLDSSLIYATQAKELSEKINYLRGLAEAYKNIGNVHDYRSNYIIATNYYEKALDIYDKLNDTIGRANCFNNLGNMSSNKADYIKSVNYYLKAVELYGYKNDSAKIALCYTNIGTDYFRLKLFDKALSFKQKALELSLKTNDLKLISACYLNMGIAYKYKKDYEKAMECYNKSLALDIKLKDKLGISKLYSNFGKFYSEIDQIDSALFYYKKSLEIKKQISDSKGIASVYSSLAEIYIKERNFNLALEYNKKGMEIAQSINTKYILVSFYDNYSKIYEETKDYKKAYKYLQKYVFLNDSINGNAVNSKLSEIEKQFEIEKREAKISSLKTENEFNARQMVKNKQIIWLWIAISILFLFLSLIGFQAYRSNKRKNLILNQQNEEIKTQRDYISSQRDIIKSELTETIVKTERLQRENLQYKLEALKNQLNPHFLFNTFSTLISLIPENQQIAEQYARNLSNVYRYILTTHDKEISRISEELEFIQAYMFMVKIRFDNRVSLDVNIAEEIQVYNIPSFSLQLLVENAVKHNIISSKRQLKIIIENDEKMISVKNNLQKKISAENSTGIGLNNIISRYKFLSANAVEIICTEEEFIVKLPILFNIDDNGKSNQYESLNQLKQDEGINS